MTIIEAAARIQQIQSTMMQLSTSAAATTNAASASRYADAVAQAQSAAGVDSVASDGSVTGADIVNEAKKYLGVPYVFGGTSMDGIDCSGLVQSTLKGLGIDSPRLVSGQATLGTEVPSLAQAKPGDLIVTNGNEHIVIYAGNGKVIHAPDVGRNVTLADNWLTDADISTIRRVASPASPASAAGPVLSQSQIARVLASVQSTFVGGDTAGTSGSGLLSLLQEGQ